MKSCGNLSLKNSYKHLQKKMWQISEKAYEINKENELLKGKVNTQRIMIKKRKNQTSHIRDMAQQQQQSSMMTVNVQKCYKINADLKQKINNLDEQRKQINEQLDQMQKLHKKHKKLSLNLKKIAKILGKPDKIESAVGSNKKLEKEQVIMGSKLQVAEKEQEQIAKCIQQALVELQEQKRNHKLLSSEVLGLIQEKNYLKKMYKLQQTNDSILIKGKQKS